MSREVRRVPADWQHPKYDAEEIRDRPYLNGRFKPLLKNYARDAEDFLGRAVEEGLQAALEYYGRAPDRDDYMPEWPEAERTHLMMYETTSEGTPISPAFETPEELARWLTDNNASAFGASGATYEQWLATAKRGWAPSAIVDDHGFRSGVEAMAS